MTLDPPAAHGLLRAATARGAAAAAIDDQAWLTALLDTEAALARASATVGLIPTEHADTIAAACRPDRFDIAAITRDGAASGNPVVPLVKALTAAVEADGHPDAAADVHRSATSQDILDTAAMLIVRRAATPLLDDLDRAIEATATLADQHRSTLVAGRTLLQQAAPTSVGLKAAGWMVGLHDAANVVASMLDGLAVQYGGAVGTQAAAAGHGPELMGALARELDLVEPPLAWHTERGRIVEIATTLARVAAAVSSVATDIVLLAQTEVGEATEIAPGRGGSSTLPHKRNPVAAISARAAAAQAPGLVSTLLHATSGHEHERAAGAWHAEWLPLTELLRTIGSAVAWLLDSLEHLDVHPERARENLARTDGLLLAEAVTTALTAELGRSRAHELITAAASTAIETGQAFRDVLGADLADVLETPPDLDALLDPASYLGSAGELVDRALEHRSRRRRGGPS